MNSKKINKNKEDYPIVLSAKEICDILHISKPTAYEVMNNPTFPLIRLGRNKRVLRDEFFDWLINNTNNN